LGGFDNRMSTALDVDTGGGVVVERRANVITLGGNGRQRTQRVKFCDCGRKPLDPVGFGPDFTAERTE